MSLLRKVFLPQGTQKIHKEHKYNMLKLKIFLFFANPESSSGLCVLCGLIFYFSVFYISVQQFSAIYLIMKPHKY